MQFFDWNGVHRRNISPTVTPGAPEPVRLAPPAQEPVRSGFPLANLGVGAFGSAGGGGPNCAAAGVARTPKTIASTVAFIAILTFHSPSSHYPERARRRTPGRSRSLSLSGRERPYRSGARRLCRRTEPRS